MHDEPIGSGDQLEAAEAAVLALLLSDGRRTWTVGELVLELGDLVDATDAVEALRGAGLVHRRGDVAFASRTAIEADRLLK
jgi:hypothetical protein